MEAPKDKRTKAYKEWKKKFNKENTIGLGDLVEKVTEATGIKKAVKFIAGSDRDWETSFSILCTPLYVCLLVLP